MSGIAIAWTVVSIVVVAAVGWAVGVMGIATPDYSQARVAFTLAAVTLAVMTAAWAVRSDEPTWWRTVASVLVGITVFVAYPEAMRWTYRLERPVKRDTVIDATIGGDSYCYLTFEGESLRRGFPRPLIDSVGEWPLYDVQVRLTDLAILARVSAPLNKADNLPLVDAEPALTVVNVGNIPAGGSALLTNPIPFSSTTSQSFNITFTARNGTWNEELRLRFVGTHWTQAYRVSRGLGKDEKILKEHSSADYPRDVGGSVAF